MGKTFQRLSMEDREHISIGLAQGKSYREIGKEINRSHTTIKREVDQNSAPINKGYYLASKAQERSSTRNRETHKRDRLKNKEILKYVQGKLIKGWSPELISGRISRFLPKQKIGYEAIYQYIYAEAPELTKCLPRKHKVRKYWGYTRKHAKNHIPGRVGIDKRPSVINQRKRFGDWELDTAVSRASKSVLLVHVERKSRLIKISKLSRKTAKLVAKVTIRKFKKLPEKLRLSITYDNGTENTDHQKINAALKTKSFFCAPFHSWEKGTVENSIGLIRRYLPKKTDFSKVTFGQIRKIENALNNRPRKCLNFSTPNEIMSGAIARGM